MKIYGNCQNYQHIKYLQEQIEDDKFNSKKLYRLVDDMMGQNKDLPLPDCGSDSELANKFNIFFIEKITKIREDLTEQEDIITNNQFNNKIKLEVFQELTQIKVEDIMKNFKNLQYVELTPCLPS